MDDGFEKTKKEQLYQKARQALENNDVLIMADVANELGVEIPEITETQLKQTEQKIISIKKELSMIESTAVWHWFFTEDPARKDDILKQLFQVMYEEQQNARS
jgi:predicted nucleotidyltransferase